MNEAPDRIDEKPGEEAPDMEVGELSLNLFFLLRR
jgi:hypothetical protein